MRDTVANAMPVLVMVAVFAIVWAVRRWLSWRDQIVLVIAFAVACAVGLVATQASYQEYTITGLMLAWLLFTVWQERPNDR